MFLRNYVLHGNNELILGAKPKNGLFPDLFFVSFFDLTLSRKELNQ
jgi:hypothetical protein